MSEPSAEFILGFEAASRFIYEIYRESLSEKCDRCGALVLGRDPCVTPSGVKLREFHSSRRMLKKRSNGRCRASYDIENEAETMRRKFAMKRLSYYESEETNQS